MIAKIKCIFFTLMKGNNNKVFMLLNMIAKIKCILFYINERNALHC
jgi:hypothetical protein